MEDEKKEVVVEQEVQKTEVEILQEKAQQAEDKYVRLFAEFDNYKKRIQSV